jgi:hypothetical protein
MRTVSTQLIIMNRNSSVAEYFCNGFRPRVVSRSYLVRNNPYVMKSENIFQQIKGGFLQDGRRRCGNVGIYLLTVELVNLYCL